MTASVLSAIYAAYPPLGEVLTVADWASVPAEAEALWLHGDAVRDWTPLARFTRLTRLAACPTRKGQLAAIGAATGIEQLELRHLGKDGLAELPALPRLKALKLDVFKGENLAGIERQASLRQLAVWHAPRLADLGPLATLAALEWLAISTPPSWDARRRLKLDSLAPLGELTGLKMLALVGIEPLNGGFGPLFGLQGLERLELVNGLAPSSAERAALATALPSAQGTWRSAE